MLYPPVAELLKKVDSRYLLVNLVAHRARQIAAEAEAFQEDLPEKPVTMAIEEVANGTLRLDNAQVFDSAAAPEAAERETQQGESGHSGAQAESAQTIGE